MIRVQSLNKTFRVAQRQAGLAEAVKALFSREYSTIQALKDVSFSIQEGEMVGYIGPNGAGKSTTIKIMCGILHPDSGTCEINGRIPWRDRKNHVATIGVVFGQRSQLWWDVPVIDSFKLLKDIYGVGEQVYRRNLDELVELLGISELLVKPTRSLSLGQRMRCELAASLLHQPRILFLDEPTIGLDAVSKIAVRQFMKKLNQERGTTVILTTHDMQDIEVLAERIILIGRGQILLDGSLSELKRRSTALKTITMEYRGDVPRLGPGMKLVDSREGRLVLELDPAMCSASEAISALAAQVEVLDLSISGVSAEEMVASLYQEYKI
ncbi:MAG: ATP-binding cassette domain-containing protein [Firmicutes bacterium]|nr:ATP-binding cassette domain-containing protein [Bacillota bacterium]